MGVSITFLSDFGLQDEWVAVCKGVIFGIFPEAVVIDITHEIPPFDIRKGALAMASALPFMPQGVHLGVVDPGVGTRRRALVLEVERGDYLVGPDNGLLIPAARALGGIEKAVEITNERYMLQPVCPTFHGRDVFAPVAAHLARGVDITEFGPSIEVKTLEKAPWPEPRIKGREIFAEVIDVDRFGTLRFSISRVDLAERGVRLGVELHLIFRGRDFVFPFCATFSEVEAGEALLLVDSSNLLSLAVNQGSAAEKFGLEIGEKVKLKF